MMTRHTYRPGDAIDPGAVYYPMDGSRQCDPLEPDDVIAALDAWAERRGEEPAPGWSDWLGWHGGQLNVPTDRNWEFREHSGGAILHGRGPSILSSGQIRYEWNIGDTPEPADHWSPWLPWKGGPCPLPDDVDVEWERSKSGTIEPACEWTWAQYCRFRYRADNPGGWLPRGDWIPPAELWDEGCPVRCEWTSGFGPDAGEPSREWLTQPACWKLVKYIRLVARQPQAGLPEGWDIRVDGTLLEPEGVPIAWPSLIEKYGPAAIRQAVDAWLREMGDE